ncbi:cysteine desulfurase family protein [Marinilabilia sp.]|uniref:cysteine desulfurase family protein n=1 Tax=Marinilabilia sp. TaxID=2021252 RepID=UPI0025BD462D|nr:cysteine desulfurase family protein [Marinilabilia sp.]
MNHPIYLDYNATTPVDQEVVDEMSPYITRFFGNPSSANDEGRKAKNAIIKARRQVAALTNAGEDEIVFTSGGTESNNHAIRGIASANRHKGNHIITSAIEHPSVTNVCNYLESIGFEISWIPVDSNGRVVASDVERAIRPQTILITIMHANNEVGTVQPIAEIGAIAKKHQIVFHTDAAQSLGKIETDVNKLNVDLLSVAGHKLYAPKGVGALYIKSGIKIDNILFGAGQEKGLRPGTENVPYIVALGKACEIAKRDFEVNAGNMFSAKERLFNGLIAKLGDRVYLNGNALGTLPNTLSVAFLGVEAHTLVSAVEKDVLISTGSACHADSIEISPVLKAMKTTPEIGTGTVRISTGKNTSFEEVDRALEVLTKIITKF